MMIKFPKYLQPNVDKSGQLYGQIDRLVQERCNSSALAMELRLSYINPAKWYHWCSINSGGLSEAQWRYMASQSFVIIGSINGIFSVLRQATTWTNDDLGPIKPFIEMIF